MEVFNRKKEDGFTIKMLVRLMSSPVEQTLLEVPGIISVNLKRADPSFRDKQNYPAFTMSDGSVPVLEASIMLTAPVEKLFKREIIIGFPIAALKKPWGEHEVILSFTGVQWTMYLDSQVVDNDFAIGYPQFGQEHSWQLNPGYVEPGEHILSCDGCRKGSGKRESVDTGCAILDTAGTQFMGRRCCHALS